ncbi:TPA: hypothetical protein L4W69_005767, partial [Pseudomonas aeruginosa]|nr:hypothetical protein [Pseudomonas aeruginosa]
LILTEADWAQKYANASSRKLIKYKDFSNPRSAATEFHSYPGHSPKDVIDGSTLLTAPQWYKTLTNWKPTGVARVADDVVYAGLGRSNPVRDAARANMLSGSNQGVCWDYATDVLREADMLTPIQAKNLTDGLKKASNYHGMGDSGRVDNLIADVRSVSNNDELLRVKPGELVVFMEVDPNLPAKGARPVHAMTSLGNGRFAGMKNDLLNGQLGSGKGILTAEELGRFRDNGFFRIGGGANAPVLEIKVGYPMGAKVPTTKPIREAAESLAREGSGVGKSWDFVADTLERSGELSREQVDAFKEMAVQLCDPPRNSPTKALKDMLVEPRLLANAAELGAVPKGHVVALSNSEFSAKELMLSLGDGKFASAQLNTLDAGLPGTKGIVTADELGRKLVDGKLSGLSLKTGPVNLEAMRVRSLLGKDSSFVLDVNKVLRINVHGAPSIVNYMDALELSHAIRGLIKVRGNGINMEGIASVELNSCYGALGSPSTGQVLADILGKKVKAYPLKYSKAIETNPEWWRPTPTTYEPRPNVTNNAEALERVTKQSMRNHNFWNKLLNLYKQSRDAVSSIRVKREMAEMFDSMLRDAGDLVMHKQGSDAESFLQKYPEYLRNADATTRAAVKAELNRIVGEARPHDAETFAQRSMEVLSLTNDAHVMLNEYLAEGA